MLTPHIITRRFKLNLYLLNEPNHLCVASLDLELFQAFQVWSFLRKKNQSSFLLINLEIPVLVQSLKSSNIRLG